MLGQLGISWRNPGEKKWESHLWRRLMLILIAFSIYAMAGRGLTTIAVDRRGILAHWRQAQEWSATHLPPGEQILVPLSQLGFRVWSRQIPAVDFQEGDALFHNPGYEGIFIDKLKLYGWTPSELIGAGHISKLEQLDRQLTSDKAIEIGRQLHARVAVRRTNHPAWDLPVLYENPDYVIYKLESAFVLSK
jgi:hypothetical protein